MGTQAQPVWGAQAACYGRAFCAADALPRDAILVVARRLRILNALRSPAIGLPLTLAQARPASGLASPCTLCVRSTCACAFGCCCL